MGVQAVGCGICGDLHRCHSNVRVRDGQVANRAFRAAIGVDLDGNRDVLGIWGSPAPSGRVGTSLGGRAALKCLHLTVRSLDPTGKGQVRWVTRWKPALNAFAITFADRWPDGDNQ